MSDDASAQRERAEAVLAQNPTRWYHTIELAPGLVTPGYIDMRRAAPKVLPDDLEGRRALDVGTFDGFWAFELERRGASVTTVDLERVEDADFPPRNRARLEAQIAEQGFEIDEGFKLASGALGSAVHQVRANIYDLDVERVGGEVDFAWIGAILTHLRDPVRALEAVRSTLRPGGELRFFEPISIRLTLRSRRSALAEFKTELTDYTWWLPNTAALGAWMREAGFERVDRIAFGRPPCHERTWYAALSGFNPG